MRRLFHDILRVAGTHTVKAFLVCGLAVFLAQAVPSEGWSASQGTAHAVGLARSGRTAEALALLQAMYDKNPQNEAVFYDYLTVLSWAGQDALVGKLANRLSVSKAPAYVIESAAKSARRRGDYVQAETFYRTGLQRFPHDLNCAVGLVLTLTDAGHDRDAMDLATKLEQQFPGQAPLQMAKEYIFEKRADYFAALQTCQRILAADPGDRAAGAKRIMLLDRLGASYLAVELADRQPALLNAGELQRILGDRASFAVRWGDLPTRHEADRFAQTDRALAMLQQNLQQARSSQGGDRDFVLRTRFDRLVALHDRFRMDAVIDEYRQLRKEGRAMPDYVLAAVADAFLYSKQPGQAKKLYLQILSHQPKDFETQLALFYTLIELEDFKAAYKLIDDLDQGQPTWLVYKENGRRQYEPNPRKITAASVAAVARMYGEQPARAEARLKPLYDMAPANPDLTCSLGDIYQARGWPRLARQTYSLGLALNPSYKALQVGKAQTLLTMRQYRQAGESIEKLYSLYPEDQHIRMLHRQWEIHNMRELRLSAGSGHSSGVTVGSREWYLEGTLFSRPLAYRYRAFLDSRLAFAAFPEGNETSRRQGAGLEYRGPNLEASGELTFNEEGNSQFGGRLSTLWELDDHWSLPANLEVYSRDTPLRALKQGITANSADLGLIYRASEERQASLKGQVMDFSDGNFRRSINADLEQRLVTLPTYKLTGIVGLNASANSRSDTIYFNPGHDFSAALTLDNLQRLYRWYDLVFSHRLSLTIGNYLQKNYSGYTMAGFAYEHIWEVAYRFELIYGFSRFRRVYDGNPEYQNEFYGRLNWRF